MSASRIVQVTLEDVLYVNTLEMDTCNVVSNLRSLSVIFLLLQYSPSSLAAVVFFSIFSALSLELDCDLLVHGPYCCAVQHLAADRLLIDYIIHHGPPAEISISCKLFRSRSSQLAFTRGLV